MLPAKKMTGNASTRANIMVKPSGTISLVIFVFMIPTSSFVYSRGSPLFTTLLIRMKTIFNTDFIQPAFILDTAHSFIWNRPGRSHAVVLTG